MQELLLLEENPRRRKRRGSTKRRTVRRHYTAAQLAAGFGGKRRKTKRRRVHHSLSLTHNSHSRSTTMHHRKHHRVTHRRHHHRVRYHRNPSLGNIGGSTMSLAKDAFEGTVAIVANNLINKNLLKTFLPAAVQPFGGFIAPLVVGFAMPRFKKPASVALAVEMSKLVASNIPMLSGADEFVRGKFGDLGLDSKVGPSIAGYLTADENRIPPMLIQ